MMMKKVAIITDSASYIPEEVRREKQIHMVSLTVIFGDEVYKEDGDLSAQEFYEKVKTGGKLPSTSQPPVGDYVALYEKLAKDHDEAVIVCLSGSLSGTVRAAQTAADIVDGLKVHVFDSEIACMAEGFYALEAADMALEGKTAEDIMARLIDIRTRGGMDAYLFVDDLSFLRRGGRLSGAQFVMGSLLKVKPVLTFRDTKVVPFETVRTRKKASLRVKELFGQDASKGDPIRAAVIHANRQKEAEEWAQEIREQYPNVDVMISYFGPVVGTHSGEGAIGIGWYHYDI